MFYLSYYRPGIYWSQYFIRLNIFYDVTFLCSYEWIIPFTFATSDSLGSRKSMLLEGKTGQHVYSLF